MPIINEVLKQAGLDEKEADIYKVLLREGGLTVLEISKFTDQKRTNLYNILQNLQDYNLVKKVSEENTTKYYPQPPKEIEKLLERREQMLHHAKLNFDILSETLHSQYNLISNKPVITYYEGLHGLEKMYQDVNDLGEDILLFRSTFDDRSKELDELVARQIVNQVKRGIHAKVIGPLEIVEEAKELYTKFDKVRLVEERFVKNFPLRLPAQVLVYGNKTAMATIRKEIIITVIDNKDITDTFRTLFDFVWQYSTPEHQEIVKDWVQEN